MSHEDVVIVLLHMQAAHPGVSFFDRFKYHLADSFENFIELGMTLRIHVEVQTCHGFSVLLLHGRYEAFGAVLCLLIR